MRLEMRASGLTFDEKKVRKSVRACEREHACERGYVRESERQSNAARVQESQRHRETEI